MLRNAEISGTIQHVIYPPQQPHHKRLDQVPILLVVHALEVEALHARQGKTVFYVVENSVIDAFANPLREITVELLGKEEIRESTILRVQQVHILHGLVDYIIVFGFQLRAAVSQQELHKGIQEFDIAFGRLQRKRVRTRAVFANPLNAAAIEFDDAFVASADIKDVGETTVFLLKRSQLIPMNGLSSSSRPEDKHDPHAIHIHILEEGRPCAGLKDIQILGIKVFRVGVSDVGNE